MAKKSDVTPAMPDAGKAEPVIHVSWPKDGIKVAGDTTAWAQARRVRVTFEGTVTGHSMADYGCSIDVKGAAITVDDLGEPAETMATTLEKGRAKVKK